MKSRNYKKPSLYYTSNGDVLSRVNNKLVDVEERLSDLLQQCSLDSFVSVDTIKRWMKDMNDEDPMTSVNMLTGLLDKENLVDVDLFQNLISAMIDLSHLLPAKKLNGETFSDILKKREKQGKPSKLHLTTTTLPPMDWINYYHKAMYYMSKQNFFQASKEFDRTFEKLLKTKTANQDIYRVFCNAGLSYVFSGKPLLGIHCIEMASELNPQYTFASEQLHKYQQGDFDEVIQLGILTEMKNNFEEWEKRPDYLHLDTVMKWSEKKILNKLISFGVAVDKEEFIKVAKTVNHPDDLAKKLFYPQTNIAGKDEDFIWIAAYALWDIYCPDEPTISSFNDVLHEAFIFVSKPEGTNKRNKKIQEAFEKTCANYLKKLQTYVFSEKTGFLQQWQKTIEDQMDPSYELKTFLTSLLTSPELEKEVLEVVYHLNKQIPHPDWIGIEIISNIIHNDPQGNELYKELKHNHPFYCYVACDIAQYYLDKEDYLHAEFYLTDALEIVDGRAEKNKLSLDTAETTIYDDYINVINLLEEVFKKSNADSKKKKLLKAKKQTVEKKSKVYSKSPKIEKIDKAMNKLFTKVETDLAEKSNAFQYYNYLTRFDINFETKEPIKTKETYLKIHPESYHNSRKSKGKNHLNKKFRPKIGRNDPCYCGSGKKYKKCCLERNRKKDGITLESR